MTTTTTEPQRVQAPRNWEKTSSGWKEHYATVEKASRHICDLIIRDIKPGSKVLDVGCGAGDPAFAVAAAVGPTGHVISIDPSNSMLEFARERLEQRVKNGVSRQSLNIEFIEYVETFCWYYALITLIVSRPFSSPLTHIMDL